LKLTLFDLDHTLQAGDSDVLWCAFLLARNELDRALFEPKNAAMEAAYRAGSVSPREFCDFYVGTLAGRSAAEWEPLRQAFLDQEIIPRLPTSAHDLVARHRAAGDLVVMTTATNRFITALTAAHLRIDHLIATECELDADGRFSGRTAGVLNMREGKVERLHAWLAERGLRLQDIDSTAYSDSINDLPLLCAVQHAVVVNPDPRLAAEARSRGWARHDLHPAG
jgi:HAD superfamily hydrolase (TIGR01490 family)